MALGFVLFALIVAPAFLNIPTISPVAMAQAQVVRGEKIDLPAPAAAFSPNTNALAVLSNAIVSGAGVALRPKLAADSNSLPELVEQDGKKYLNLTFATLASFPFKVTPEVADANAGNNPDIASRQAREQAPDAVRAFSEKPAAITGFMMPVRVSDGMRSDFLLLRNQSACCYGILPRVNEWVIVRMAGKGVKPVMAIPITALGTFQVGEMREKWPSCGLLCAGLRPTVANQIKI